MVVLECKPLCIIIGVFDKAKLYWICYVLRFPDFGYLLSAYEEGNMENIDSNRINLLVLHPELVYKLEQLDEALKFLKYRTSTGEKVGLKIFLTEGLRTKEHQDDLYAQGRTKPGSIITNAPGSSYSSMHQWGIAVDFALDVDINGNGKKSDDAYNNSYSTFKIVGEQWEKLGGEWGGNWKSIKDNPHLQLREYGSTPSTLKSLYGTPEKFFKSWEKLAQVNSDKDSGQTGHQVGQVNSTSSPNSPQSPNSQIPKVLVDYHVGDRVKIKKEGKQYSGAPIKDYYKNRTYTIEVYKGDRVVLSYQGVIMYAVKVKDIELQVPFYIRTNCDSLNIRRGPSTDYKVVGEINEVEGLKNLYTIVEVSGNWGRLKSGIGWVSLNYCRRA